MLVFSRRGSCYMHPRNFPTFPKSDLSFRCALTGQPSALGFLKTDDEESDGNHLPSAYAFFVAKRG